MDRRRRPTPLSGQPQTNVHRLRVTPPGRARFEPIRTVATEQRPIPFGGTLSANSFRVATYPKSEVKEVNGKPRVYVVWDACSERPLPNVCELPKIKLKYSDNLGASWSRTSVLSEEGANYFPTISADPAGEVAVGYFTSRYDPVFDNRQDVELLSLDADGGVTNRQRATAVSNEPEADPTLGAFFIGDYIEVFADDGEAYLHYNANYRREQLLQDGLPVPQQDNFLIRAGL